MRCLLLPSFGVFASIAYGTNELYFERVAAYASDHHCHLARSHSSTEKGAPHFNNDPKWRLKVRSVLQGLFEVNASKGLPLAGGEVYQFGVGGCWTMQILRRLFPKRRLLGFDSFGGLPEEAEHVYTHETWGRGSMNFPAKAIPACVHRLGGIELARFVPGFYNESLMPDADWVALFNPQPAVYIDVDVDLYISSVQALDFMFKMGLARVGTLIGYDDWWVIPCSLNTTDVFDTGEGRAHFEITHKYGVRFKCVSGSCAYPRGGPFGRCSILQGWGTVFVVMEIGSDSPETGFEVLPEQIQIWHRNCPPNPPRNLS